MFAPAYPFNIGNATEPVWMNHWREDPMQIDGKICAGNLISSKSMTGKILDEVAPKVTTPFLLVLAHDDVVVSN